MASTTAPSAALTTTAPTPTTRRSSRWDSLDVLRGLGLWLMVAHHLSEWTGGNVGERFIGFDGFVVTDLAAPIFAVALGASAHLVGLHIVHGDGIDLRRLRTASLRWGQVLALGLAIDIAVGGGIDGGGVLPTLAVLGAAVMALTIIGLRSAVAWWGMAVVCALGAVPVSRLSWTGLTGELWTGPFSIVVYGVFASAGAALAATAHPAGERALPLLRATLATLVIGAAAAQVVPQWIAPDGIWPPQRHPGNLAFTMWGLAATLALWAVIRQLVSTEHLLGRGLARAGRRTLLVFGAHYVVKLVLQRADLLGDLDTRAWGIAAWAAIAAICAASMLPLRSDSR